MPALELAKKKKKKIVIKCSYIPHDCKATYNKCL